MEVIFFPIHTLYNSNIVYAFAYVCSSTTLHTTHIMSKKKLVLGP